MRCFRVFRHDMSAAAGLSATRWFTQNSGLFFRSQNKRSIGVLRMSAHSVYRKMMVKPDPIIGLPMFISLACVERARPVSLFCQRYLCLGALAAAVAGCGTTQPAVPASVTSDVALTLRSTGAGLPRSGQWRSQIAIADMNDDGRPDIVLPAARKGDGRPRIFIAQSDGAWARWTQMRQPRMRYDYGGVAVLDFDGDNRLDLAFGMHLRGVAAMRQSGAMGEFHDASAGLNETAEGVVLLGSSVSLATLPPTARNGAPRLLVVYEPQNARGARGATLWQFGNDRWSREDVIDAPRGTHALTLGGIAYYLASDGVARIDPRVTPARAQRLAPLPEGSYAHAFALTSQGDGLVSTSRYESGAWVRRIERFASLSTADQAVMPTPTGVERRGDERYTAVAATSAQAWGLPGDLVVVGAEHGKIELFHLDRAGGMKRVGELATSDWRRRCTVASLGWAKLSPGERPSLIAAFSGEVSVHDFGGGCASGGGVDVFSVER